MWRPLLGLMVSAALLGSATYAWVDLFVFGKAVQLPSFALALPAPMFFPTYIAALCLLPAAVLPSTLASAVRIVLGAIALGTCGALVAYWAQWESGKYVLGNAVFNWAYAVLRYGLPAGVLLLFGRSLPVVVRRMRG